MRSGYALIQDTQEAGSYSLEPSLFQSPDAGLTSYILFQKASPVGTSASVLAWICLEQYATNATVGVLVPLEPEGVALEVGDWW